MRPSARALFLCVVAVLRTHAALDPCAGLAEAIDVSSYFKKLLSRRLTFALLGAHDGVSNDYAYSLAVEHGWSGVALEPHPTHHAKAVALYREARLDVHVLRSAVCAKDVKTLPFYYVDTAGLPFPWWVAQISSLSEQHVLNHNYLLNRAPKSCAAAELPDTCLRDKILERIRTTRVSCSFTHHLARRYAPNLLISDVEGLDDEIVRSWLEIQRPKYIVAEIKNLADHRPFLRSLQRSGYCVQHDGHDAYAVLKEKGSWSH